jgi:hypothetical protein
MQNSLFVFITELKISLHRIYNMDSNYIKILRCFVQNLFKIIQASLMEKITANCLTLNTKLCFIT